MTCVIKANTGGRYRIEVLLRQGGTSAVYKAYDANLKRSLEIKMIHTQLAGEVKFLARFEAEATAAARQENSHSYRISFEQ